MLPVLSLFVSTQLSYIRVLTRQCSFIVIFSQRCCCILLFENYRQPPNTECKDFPLNVAEYHPFQFCAHVPDGLRVLIFLFHISEASNFSQQILLNRKCFTVAEGFS